MQVAGKTLVLATFAIGFAMAGGAWWYNYKQSRLAAEFWGRRAATLLVGNSEVTLQELGEPGPDGVGGRAVIREFELTDKRGLVHLRHALTYDANFAWDERRREPVDDGSAWAYALRFATSGRELVVLFSHDFEQLGRLAAANAESEVDVLPCPRLGPVLLAYLAQEGVQLDAPPAAMPR